ncbi:hypothetical protein [uncultured Kriegella sp.]|uniref:hypothetical protein n=1 Tax=uncultured Kriegella sp. TaxID=1798910 RepID=UPI0030DB4B68|tara:strand:+ start:125891 stop:126328 length:438 start_codon:yes stop_codon:yes gene_type:complete
MKMFWTWAKPKLFVDVRLIVTYCFIYFLWGWSMNWLGTELEIAKFTYWWQIISCYLLYMVPVSLLLRGLPFHMQYAYGLVAMGFLEFGGYALETSYAYPNNLLDQLFGIRNFSLGMALFFALYFPLGNRIVTSVYSRMFHGTKNG